MTTILHLDASSRPIDNSYSRKLSQAALAALTEGHSDVVVRRDLAVDPPPHIVGDARANWTMLGSDRTPEQAGQIALSEKLIAELRSADVIVIGSPMYNFSVPSALKAWIDHVVIAGQTFRYTDQGPIGLLKDKRAILALASDGIYTSGPASNIDHLEPYLRVVLEFIGIADIQVVRSEGLAFGPDKASESFEHGLAQASELTGRS